MAAVLISIAPVIVFSTPTNAATVGSLQQQASDLQEQIASTTAQIGALGQAYDQARYQLDQIDNQITITKNKISNDQQRVTIERMHLRAAAIESYVNEGSDGQSNPLFSGSQTTFAIQQELGKVAASNLDVAIADFRGALVALDGQKANLDVEQNSAQSAVNTAYEAQQEANTKEGQLNSELAQVKGQIGTLEAAAQRAAEAAQASQTAIVMTAGSTATPPPPNTSAGGVAVAAAESQLGVPYLFGGETPGVGFDCSGLTAWAWGKAGVSLPHYSGGQYQDSTPVPVSNMEPGDLLFYGPGGGDHVAMYVGGGQMIEAPETGQVVHITPIRLADGFVGAGRP